ncbi:MAG: hypothetical protein Q4G13_04735 [Moraxella sp.]|nr:hypothetical protein [Moraxella sp.]
MKKTAFNIIATIFAFVVYHLVGVYVGFDSAWQSWALIIFMIVVCNLIANLFFKYRDGKTV